jgi:hypothetical protein
VCIHQRSCIKAQRTKNAEDYDPILDCLISVTHAEQRLYTDNKKVVNQVIDVVVKNSSSDVLKPSMFLGILYNDIVFHRRRV